MADGCDGKIGRQHKEQVEDKGKATKELARLDQMHASLQADQFCYENAVLCRAEVGLFQSIVEISDQAKDGGVTAADIVHRQRNGRKQNAGNQNVIHATFRFFIYMAGRRTESAGILGDKYALSCVSGVMSL